MRRGSGHGSDWLRVTVLFACETLAWVLTHHLLVPLGVLARELALDGHVIAVRERPT